MRFTYSITFKDFQNAQELHWKQSVLRRVVNFSSYWLIPVLVSAFVITLLNRFGLFFVKFSIIRSFILGFAAAAVVTSLGYSSQKRKRYSKRFEKSFPPDMRIAWCEADDRGIISAILGTDEESWPWAEIVCFAQSEKITLFYLNQKRFLFFPTGALSHDERDELNALLSRHLTNR